MKGDDANRHNERGELSDALQIAELRGVAFALAVVYHVENEHRGTYDGCDAGVCLQAKRAIAAADRWLAR